MVSLEFSCANRDEQPIPTDLMERIISPLNLNKAYKRVLKNEGSCGVDGMEVSDLKEWLRRNFQTLQDELQKGIYKPQPVLGVQIPKPQGGFRQLGIPTVVDRLVQQAIHQVLSIYYEPEFSESSYGFRPNRSAHQALKCASEKVKSGRIYVIDLDLEKFFDEVNHHRLEWLLSKRIKDKRVLSLIRRYLQSGLMQGGLISQRLQGTPQGGPLSPLLSNIVLDELDKELESRGHNFVRYADDVKIFVKSQLSAKRVQKSVTDFIERKLLLKVNRSKSKICFGYELNFLGHSILEDGSLGLSKQSKTRFKQRVKEITRRNRGISIAQLISELNLYTKGWLRYFRHCKMKTTMESLDGWIRRKVRCFKLKQCKRCIGIVRFLRKLKVKETLCWRTGLSGKSWWRLSNSPGSNIGMTKKWFNEQGYYNLYENFLALNRVKL